MNIPADVISRAQSGDRSARDEIITHYLPLIKTLAKKYSSRDRPAEDLVSEGVLAVIEAIPDYRAERGPLGQYLWGCIRNWYGAILDKDKRVRSRLSAVDVERLGDPEDCFCPAAGDDGAAELLLSNLPEQKRLLLKRYYGIGQPADAKSEIAGELGISEPALWKRVERIKLELVRHAVRQEIKSSAS